MSALNPLDDDSADKLIKGEQLPDPPPLSTKDLTLQAQLALYKRAIEEEFSIENNPELANPEKVAELAREKLLQAVPKAIAQLGNLAENGASENVRLSASKYILDNVLGEKAYAKPKEDPLQSLINSLTGEEPPTETTES